MKRNATVAQQLARQPGPPGGNGILGGCPGVPDPTK